MILGFLENQHHEVEMGAKHFVILICLVKSFSAFAGPGTSGGGNGLNHQLIEEYAVLPVNLPGYKEVFWPKIQKLKKKYPVLAQEMERKVIRLRWYVVPAQMKMLAQELTGLPFPSEQMAIQKNDEVFISKVLLMNPKTRPATKGVLILHEVMMAMHLSWLDLAEKNHRELKKANPALADQVFTVDASLVRNVTSAISTELFDVDAESFEEKFQNSKLSLILQPRTSDQIKTIFPTALAVATELKTICSQAKDLEHNSQRYLNSIYSVVQKVSSEYLSAVSECGFGDIADKACQWQRSADYDVMQFFLRPLFSSLSGASSGKTETDYFSKYGTAKFTCAAIQRIYRFNFRFQNKVMTGQQDISQFDFFIF